METIWDLELQRKVGRAFLLLFSLEKGSLRGDLTSASQGQNVLVFCDRKRGKGHKQTQGNLSEEMGKLYFEGDRALERLPRETMGCPYLEILKTHLDLILYNLLQVKREAGPEDLQRCLPTPTIL